MIGFHRPGMLANLRRAFAAVCSACQGEEFARALICGRCARLIPAELAAQKSAFELLGMYALLSQPGHIRG